MLHHLKHLVKNNENITTLGTQQVQSSGKDKMYEYVKKEIRARYGKDAINDKNKHKLKSLAIAAPFCSFSRENQHPKWELASKMFAEKPFSNGHDKRYEEVKAIIRKKFGESAINESNKARLKALALAGKQSKDLQAVGAHPKWKLAQDMFSRSPYSNGNDYRYEAVKNEIRFRWGKKSITDKDKPLLKALAVAAPYFVDMDVAEDSEMSKPSLTSSPSRAKSVVGAGVWIPDTSACMRCSRKFGCMYLFLTFFSQDPFYIHHQQQLSESHITVENVAIVYVASAHHIELLSS